MIGKGYFVLQAATLLKLAQTTTDPKVWAALVEKAAELNSHVEEASALADLTPVKEKKTAEELASMIRQDLSEVDACPRLGAVLT